MCKPPEAWAEEARAEGTRVTRPAGPEMWAEEARVTRTAGADRGGPAATTKVSQPRAVVVAVMGLAELWGLRAAALQLKEVGESG